jgi:hypothetical protein
VAVLGGNGIGSATLVWWRRSFGGKQGLNLPSSIRPQRSRQDESLLPSGQRTSLGASILIQTTACHHREIADQRERREEAKDVPTPEKDARRENDAAKYFHRLTLLCFKHKNMLDISTFGKFKARDFAPVSFQPKLWNFKESALEAATADV